MFFKNYYEADGTSLAESAMGNMDGVMRISLNKDMWKELYRDGDTRKAGSLKDIYAKNEDGSLKYVGNISISSRVPCQRVTTSASGSMIIQSIAMLTVSWAWLRLRLCWARILLPKSTR